MFQFRAFQREGASSGASSERGEEGLRCLHHRQSIREDHPRGRHEPHKVPETRTQANRQPQGVCSEEIISLTRMFH